MRKNRRTRASVFGPLISVLAVILGLVLVGPISPANAVDKVDVCHRTASESNPYVLINVPQDEANGHITGTDKQHNHKVYWDTAGTWDGMQHAAGDERMDYYASDGISGKCTNGQQPPPETNDASFASSVKDATCEVGEVLTYSGSNVAFEGPASPVTGPATDVEVIATPDNGHGWTTGNASGTRTVFEGDLAGPNPALCEQTTPKDADATVDITPATCDTGEVASEGDTQHASWVSEDDVTGPGSYSFTANADSNHQFGDGSTQKDYSDDLAGPNKALCDDGDHNPPGNNGTIKVDDDNLPDCWNGGSEGVNCNNGVGNDPHLGCTFYVEWYNYEANATSTVSFDVQSPTGGTVTVVQGTATKTLDGDGPDGASQGGFDGSELYQLSFSDAPQPNQGWHVKVTTHTTSSNGDDEKSKVFWVQGDCQPIPTTPSVTMVDNCGTANDSGPTYTEENDYWTTSQGEGSILFHAKEGYTFPAGESTSQDGKTYTVSYPPNTDVPCPGPCDQVETPSRNAPSAVVVDENPCESSAVVDLNQSRTCDVGQSATPGDLENAYWEDEYSTVHGPGSYNFVAHANPGYHFPAGAGVSEDGMTKTFSGELLGPDTSLCTPRKPNPVPVSETVQGCDLSAYGLEPGTGHRDGLEDWLLVDGQWVLQAPVWGDYVQDTTLTDDEYQAQCAGPQPEPQQRVVHQQNEGCTVGGVHTWDDVYTTPYVWDADTQTWVLGDEEGPVVENETFTGYTTQEQVDLGCIEVEGEQGHQHHPGKHHDTPEVKGEQATVPTQVEAGLVGTPAEHAPAGGSNLPLWLLSLGAGMFLTGAGRLRRRGGSHR